MDNHYKASIIKYLVAVVLVGRLLLELLHLVLPRKGHGHLAPQFSDLLRVDLDLDGPLLEVLLELEGAALEVVVPVLVQLADVQAVLYPDLVHLQVLAGKHDLEGLRLVVHHVLRQRGGRLLGQVPLRDVEGLVDLLLLAVEAEAGLGELVLQGLLDLEDLEVAVEVVPDVLEEGVEVLLDDLELPPQQVPPLDHHVVQGHEGGVQLAQPLGLGRPVEHLPRLFVQLSAEVAHLVEGVDFLDLQVLQRLALPGQALVQPLYLGDEALHLLQVGPGLSIEEHLHLSGVSLHLADVGVAGLLFALLLELGELAGLSDAQEALHVLVVLELSDVGQVVEEVLQDAHALLDVPLRPLGRLLLGDRWHDLRGISGPEVAPQPDEIAVPPPHHPVHLEGGHLELEEGSGSDAEEAASALPLRTE